MAASLALAGFTGGEGESDEAALPYVNAPEFMVPGEPRWYATAVTLCGYAQPVLGKTHVGRPVKLEGNPDHPATRGGTDPFLQAALLDLYDPDRSAAPLRDGRPVTWAEVERAGAPRFTAGRDRRAGLPPADRDRHVPDTGPADRGDAGALAGRALACVRAAGRGWPAPGGGACFRPAARPPAGAGGGRGGRGAG
jgi:anaerobic selenocysteine-containing dehydrogenase